VSSLREGSLGGSKRSGRIRGERKLALVEEVEEDDDERNVAS